MHRLSSPLAQYIYISVNGLHGFNIVYGFIDGQVDWFKHMFSKNEISSSVVSSSFHVTRFHSISNTAILYQTYHSNESLWSQSTYKFSEFVQFISKIHFNRFVRFFNELLFNPIISFNSHFLPMAFLVEQTNSQRM